jgi:hypothetical protein
MPAKSEKQRKFMGADLARAKAGKKTKTGMNVQQLSDFAKKPGRGDPQIGKKRQKAARSQAIGKMFVSKGV